MNLKMMSFTTVLLASLLAQTAQARVIRNSSATVSSDVSYQWVSSESYEGPRFVEHANLTVYNKTKLSPSYIQCEVEIKAYGEAKRDKKGASTPAVGFPESDDLQLRPKQIVVKALTPVIAPNSGIVLKVFVGKWLDYGGAHKMKVKKLHCESVH